MNYIWPDKGLLNDVHATQVYEGLEKNDYAQQDWGKYKRKTIDAMDEGDQRVYQNVLGLILLLKKGNHSGHLSI